MVYIFGLSGFLNYPCTPHHDPQYSTVHCNESFIECGPGSAVSIVTRYGLDGPGIEFWWARGFPHPSRPTLWPTKPPVQ